MIKSRVPNLVIDLLTDARRKATLETASFGMPGETVTFRGQEIPIDQFIKSKIRSHHESYVLYPLDQALAWAKGYCSTNELEFFRRTPPLDTATETVAIWICQSDTRKGATQMAQDLSGYTAAQLRDMAAQCRKRSAESWERSDTDGFLSQWASDIGAIKYEMQATIVDQGGRAKFWGLYHGDRRIIAKLCHRQNPYSFAWESFWLLSDAEAATFGRKFIPSVSLKKSRIQTRLGMSERQEWDAAEAEIVSNGTGLSGCASARVVMSRMGDEWGRTATLVQEVTTCSAV